LDGGPGNDRIEGGTGRNTIYGGPGNDEIIDGDGGSEIHTGPGRNRVTSEGGDDVIHVGAGHNTLTGGPGATTYIVAYGGVTVITDWGRSDRLDLSTWPQKPKITAEGGDLVLRCGTAAIVLEGISNSAQVAAAITGP